jgi:hypothetical protein
MASPSWCCYPAAATHHIVMTMLLVASFSLLSILPKLVSAVYNCSNETVVPEATDFFHHLKTSCNLLQAEVGSNSNHMMHIESIDPKSNRTLSVWADCGLEEDASYCRVIYVLLKLKLPFAWMRSGWEGCHLCFNLLQFPKLDKLQMLKQTPSHSDNPHPPNLDVKVMQASESIKIPNGFRKLSTQFLCVRWRSKLLFIKE